MKKTLSNHTGMAGHHMPKRPYHYLDEEKCIIKPKWIHLNSSSSEGEDKSQVDNDTGPKEGVTLWNLMCQELIKKNRPDLWADLVKTNKVQKFCQRLGDKAIELHTILLEEEMIALDYLKVDDDNCEDYYKVLDEISDRIDKQVIERLVLSGFDVSEL